MMAVLVVYDEESIVISEKKNSHHHFEWMPRSHRWRAYGPVTIVHRWRAYGSGHHRDGRSVTWNAFAFRKSRSQHVL